MASKRHLRRRACERKATHATREGAIIAAAKLRKSFNGGTWAAYHCRWCGCWHVGRPTARQRQATRARRAATAE